MVSLIPAGASPRTFGLDVEQVAVGLSKLVTVTRQVVSTPIRKLMEAGLITSEEFGAAVRWREDYEQAFLTSRNPLECVQVDGERGGGDINGAMFHKALCAIRFGDTEAALGPRIAHVLRIIVLEDRDAGPVASFTAVGAEVAPDASPRSQQEIGRGRSITALQSLAWVYEHNAPDRRHLGKTRGRDLTGGGPHV